MGRHHNKTKAYPLSAQQLFFFFFFFFFLSHSALYVIPHKQQTRQDGLQNFDAHHRTNSRRTLDQPPGTTTRTDEDEDRLTLGTSELAAPSPPTTPQSETQNSNLLLSCDPLTPALVRMVAASATPGSVVELPHFSRSLT